MWLTGVGSGLTTARVCGTMRLAGATTNQTTRYECGGESELRDIINLSVLNLVSLQRKWHRHVAGV